MIIWVKQRHEKNVVDFSVFQKEPEIVSGNDFHTKDLSEDASSEDVSPAIKVIGDSIDEDEPKKKKRRRKADKLSDRRKKVEEAQF